MTDVVYCVVQRFQKTVEALEEEGQAEKRQVIAVHQQRVEAHINGNKRVAMENYLQAVKQTPPQVQIMTFLLDNSHLFIY